MPHLDPDDLAVTALDASYATPDELDHLQGCSECTDEVNSFRATAARLDGVFGEYPQEPSAGTWNRIAAELDREQRQDPPATADTRATPAPTEQDPRDFQRAPGRAGPRAGSPTPASSPTMSASRPIDTAPPGRRGSFLQRAALPLAAAVAGLLIGGGAVGWWLSGRSTSDPVATATVLAVSPLGPIDAVGDGRFGRAELIGTDAGPALQVDAAGLPSVAGDYQVWLLGDAGRMVSLGVLHEGSGTFAVPDHLDLNRYRTVDISDEPDDGNPLHSGVSIARGELP